MNAEYEQHHITMSRELVERTLYGLLKVKRKDMISEKLIWDAQTGDVTIVWTVKK